MVVDVSFVVSRGSPTNANFQSTAGGSVKLCRLVVMVVVISVKGGKVKMEGRNKTTTLDGKQLT